MATPDVQKLWVDWAVDAINDAQEDYEKYEKYYYGEHDLEFATDRWENTFGTTFKEFADNWCQVVVDSAAQRLEIIGWESEDDKESATLAEDIWDRNNLQIVAPDVHTQGFIKGDSYLIVWPKEDAPDEADIAYNDAVYVATYYDPSDRRKLIRAAKRFTDAEGKTHLHLYEQDRLIFLVAEGPNVNPKQIALLGLQGLGDGSEDIATPPTGWVFENEGIADNKFGQVPVFHFKNRSHGSTHGFSELKAVIPVQNAVNKLLMDLMVASEFGSFRQKWVSGGAPPKNADGTVGWRAGADRVWHTTDPAARFGDFDATDLEPIFKSIDALVGHIAKITQTPMHYLRTSGDMPSGEALKTAESGLIKKIYDRQVVWGSAWTQAMSFAIQVETGEKLKSPVTPVWKSPETRHDLEQGQVAQLKSILGIPLTTLWSEHFGYSKEKVAEFEKQNHALAAAVLAQVVAQVGQLPPGTQSVAADPQALIELIKASGAVQPQMQTDGSGGGLDISQVLALLKKSQTAQTTAGEATTKPQPNTRPPASPTRRSSGFKD